MMLVIIGASMLYGMLGVSAFVGIACVPLSTPLTWLVAKLTYRKPSPAFCPDQSDHGEERM